MSKSISFCGLTGLAIAEKTPVTGILILTPRQKRIGIGACAGQWFEPASLPFTGFSDGTGGLVADESLAFEIFRACLPQAKDLSAVQILDSTRNDWDNLELSFPCLDLPDEDGETPRTPGQPVGLWFARTDAWNKLLEGPFPDQAKKVQEASAFLKAAAAGKRWIESFPGSDTLFSPGCGLTRHFRSHDFFDYAKTRAEDLPFIEDLLCSGARLVRGAVRMGAIGKRFEPMMVGGNRETLGEWQKFTRSLEGKQNGTVSVSW